LFVDHFKTINLKCPPKPPERKAKIKKKYTNEGKGGSLATMGEGFYGLVDLAVMDGDY